MADGRSVDDRPIPTRAHRRRTPRRIPTDGIPLPPPRPKVLVAYVPALKPIPFFQRIAGSATILPARFIPFPRHPA